MQFKKLKDKTKKQETRLINLNNNVRMIKDRDHRMENGSYIWSSFRFRRVTCINRYLVLRKVRESYSTEVLAYSPVVFKSCR